MRLTSNIESIDTVKNRCEWVEFWNEYWSRKRWSKNRHRIYFHLNLFLYKYSYQLTLFNFKKGYTKFFCNNFIFFIVISNLNLIIFYKYYKASWNLKFWTKFFDKYFLFINLSPQLDI